MAGLVESRSRDGVTRRGVPHRVACVSVHARKQPPKRKNQTGQLRCSFKSNHSVCSAFFSGVTSNELLLGALGLASCSGVGALCQKVMINFSWAKLEPVITFNGLAVAPSART